MIAVRSLFGLLLATLTLGVSPVDAVSEPPPTVPTGVEAAANPFLPEDERVNLSDCVSVLPRPECGSKTRGGWRQGLVFGALVAGMGVVGARLALSVRRRDRSQR